MLSLAVWLMYEVKDYVSPLVVSVILATAVVLVGLIAAPGREVYVKIYCRDTPINSQLIDRINKVVGPYVPPWWYSGILGTLIPFGRDLPLEYDREIVVNENNSSFAVDWLPRQPYNEPLSNKTKRIIIFMPGLGLSSQHVSLLLR
jgi:hypothetical protein